MFCPYDRPAPPPPVRGDAEAHGHVVQGLVVEIAPGPDCRRPGVDVGCPGRKIEGLVHPGGPWHARSRLPVVHDRGRQHGELAPTVRRVSALFPNLDIVGVPPCKALRFESGVGQQIRRLHPAPGGGSAKQDETGRQNTILPGIPHFADIHAHLHNIPGSPHFGRRPASELAQSRRTSEFVHLVDGRCQQAGEWMNALFMSAPRRPISGSDKKRVAGTPSLAFTMSALSQFRNSHP